MHTHESWEEAYGTFPRLGWVIVAQHRRPRLEDAGPSSAAPAHDTSGNLCIPWGLTHRQSPNPAGGLLAGFACRNIGQVFQGKLAKLEVQTALKSKKPPLAQVPGGRANKRGQRRRITTLFVVRHI